MNDKALRILEYHKIINLKYFTNMVQERKKLYYAITFLN